MQPDAVLYLITQPYLSARRFARLSQGLVSASGWYRLDTSSDMSRFADALASGDPLPELTMHEVHHEIR